MSVAKKKNQELWSRIVSSVKSGSKGGDPGQWSARKAQIAVSKYTEADHAKAQHFLIENFFSDRPVFYGYCNATIAEDLCLEY